jgi:hypothetical protein
MYAPENGVAGTTKAPVGKVAGAAVIIAGDGTAVAGDGDVTGATVPVDGT